MMDVNSTDILLKKEEYSGREWRFLLEVLNVKGDKISSVHIKGDMLIETCEDCLFDTDKALKAVELFKSIGAVFPVELGRFGTYTQYELAGERVNFYLLDDFDNDGNAFSKDSLTVDETIDEICGLLDFLEEDLEQTGQCTLLLLEDGTFDTGHFRI